MADPGGVSASPESPPEAAEPLRCRNCGGPVPESYCTRCGQHREAGVVSLRRMAAEFAEDQLTLGAALPRTLLALFFRPGFLTREYAAGRVVDYIRPFRLFLVATVLLFLAASWRVQPFIERQGAASLESAPATIGAEGRARYDNVNINADTSKIPRWLHPLVRRVEARAERLNAIPSDQLLRAQIRATLDAAARVTFLLVPAFALLLLILHWWRRRLYAEHFVFALHFHAAAFLLVTLGLAVNHGAVWAVIGVYILGYLLVALRRAYDQSWWLASVKTLVVISTYPTAIGLLAGAAAIVAFFLV